MILLTSNGYSLAFLYHCRTKEVLLLKGMSLLVAASAVLAFSTLDNENCLSAKTDGSFMLPNLIDTVSGVSAVQSNYEMLLETPIVAIDSTPEVKKDTVVVDTIKFKPVKVVKEFIGPVTWYGPRFYGKKTASGQVYDPKKYTAAKLSINIPGLKLGKTRARVTNLKTGKSIEVCINDKGSTKTKYLLDLSEGAFASLCNKSAGGFRAKIEILN